MKAIASGKGGVGKSTVASNIACGLKNKGLKVGLLDLDIYGPSLPIILGLNQKPDMTEKNRLIPLDRYGMKVMSFIKLVNKEDPIIPIYEKYGIFIPEDLLTITAKLI